MAASGLVRFGRRISRHLVSPSLKESLKAVKHKQTNRRNFFTTCADQGSTPVMMPALSPTMTEGTIVKWHKKEGEAVAPGDILCDIQTDKAVVSMEIEEEGILAKILKPENTADIKIGTMIAVMVEEGDDWQSAEIPDTPTSGDKPSQDTPTASKPSPPKQEKVTETQSIPESTQ